MNFFVQALNEDLWFGLQTSTKLGIGINALGPMAAAEEQNGFFKIVFPGISISPLCLFRKTFRNQQRNVILTLQL